MKYWYRLGLFLVMMLPAVAQHSASRLLPTGFRSGSHRLKSGDWQRAKLYYDAQSLRVSAVSHRPGAPEFTAEQVQALVLGRDTFMVAREVAISRPVQHLRSAFVRQLYRRGGFRVRQYVVTQVPPAPLLAYTLLTQGNRLAAVLPSGNVESRLALTKARQDFPVLSHQLELGPRVLPT